MTDQPQTTQAEAPLEPLIPSALEAIREALRGLRFGQVLIVVHEGAVVQIDRTERKRISRNGEIA